MKEVFLLKAGNADMYKIGTGTSVLKDGDFFEIKKYIALADAARGKKVPVTMLHTHPRGAEQLSQDDIDTLAGFRFGLDRDFFAGIVLPDWFEIFKVRLENKEVSIDNITNGSFLRRSVIWFGLFNDLKRIRAFSQYDK